MADRTATSTPYASSESTEQPHEASNEPAGTDFSHTADGRSLEKDLARDQSLYNTYPTQRTQSNNNILSKVRSGGHEVQPFPFTHPLYHVKTADDVIVQFDGPDDPYLPLNWSFSKKAVTTVLYGLSTMGRRILFSTVVFFLPLCLRVWTSTDSSPLVTGTTWATSVYDNRQLLIYPGHWHQETNPSMLTICLLGIHQQLAECHHASVLARKCPLLARH